MCTVLHGAESIACIFTECEVVMRWPVSAPDAYEHIVFAVNRLWARSSHVSEAVGRAHPQPHGHSLHSRSAYAHTCNCYFVNHTSTYIHSCTPVRLNACSIAKHLAPRIQRSLENALRIEPFIVQGLFPARDAPQLLQLPHLREDLFSHLSVDRVLFTTLLLPRKPYEPSPRLEMIFYIILKLLLCENTNKRINCSFQAM